MLLYVLRTYYLLFVSLIQGRPGNPGVPGDAGPDGEPVSGSHDPLMTY